MRKENFGSFVLNFLAKSYPLYICILVFIIYYSTASRSVNEFDSGELAATQAFWGIPHPTSYPLFNLLGFLFSKIPLPFDTIIKLNMLPVIWNTLTIYFLFISIKILLENLTLISNKKLFFLAQSLSNWEILCIASIGALSFAWSVTFWIQATKIEVYSFQIFLTSIIINVAIKIFIGALKNEPVKKISKYWIVIAIFLGLGFSNHLMTVYLLPSLIYLLIITNTEYSFKVKTFLKVTLITFTIATFFYIIMMFRAQASPPYMFGEPYNIEGLINNVIGKDYSLFMFNGLDSVKKQSSKFLTVMSFNINRSDFIGGEFSLNIIFIFSGMFLSFIFLRKIFHFIFITIITSLFFAFNYSIPDINEYFLVVFFLFSLFTSFFLFSIIIILPNKRWYKLFFLILPLLFTLSQLIFNYKSVDRSNDHFTESYTKAVLNSLPPNSTLLSTDWDYIISPALYIQKVQNYRDDVEIIIPTWLEKRWYKPEIKQKFSNILEFLDREYYISFDIIRDMILKNKFRVKENTFIIPDLLTFKVVKDNNYHPIELKEINIQFNKRMSENEKYYLQLICWILEERVKYELQFNKHDNAKKLASMIKLLDSSYQLDAIIIQ